MSEHFDAIVVGAGPAGNAAAYTMAKAGLKVLQIERGEYSGSKNVQGAILYSDALERIIPDFREDAPLERHVIEQRVWVLDDESCTGGTYRSAEFSKPPYNRYTIIRAPFDRWFSRKVRDAGALVICETTVLDLHMDGRQVVGVRTDRENGSVYADIVVLADGVNSLLARKAGFHEELKPRDVALAVKEIHFLPETTIEERFNVKGTEGVVIEMAGKITQGMVGTGFLYTNKESVTVGVGCLLSDFKKSGVAPYALLEQMKAHPAIQPLLAGGEMKEYTAHLIPEGGYNAIPPVYGDGWLMVGDAGMFVNGVHREGSNLAMTTGRIAAETIIDLKVAGKPLTAQNLARYRKALDRSFVMKDLRKYKNMPDIMDRNRQFFTAYPNLVSQAAHTLLTVDGIDKKTKERSIRKAFTRARSTLGLFADAFRLWRAFE